jgi:MoxR-like ATPase
MNNKINEFIKQVEIYHKGDIEIIKKILAVYLSGGNLLINDVPGTGKSNLSKIIAKSIDLTTKRIQFTSDLMPSDIIGVKIYDPSQKIWSVSKGPIFQDIVFADEINRAPPQTQSALLEPMSEKQVSIDGETFKLNENHFVIATQNPNEFSGTYPLPEAQLDRFTACLTLGYLSEEDEIDVIMRDEFDLSKIKPILNSEDIKNLKREINEIKIHRDIAGIIVKILNESRKLSDKDEINNGLSVRAGIALKQVCKAYAFICGINIITPDIIFSLAPDVLKHRISDGSKMTKILNSVKENVYERTK